MAGATFTNNRPRKSLADQLDRLDGILDALSDGLNGAVRDVVEQAVERAAREAVRTAIAEVLANAELRRRLAMPSAPGPIKRAWNALGGLAKGCWNWIAGTVRCASGAVARLTTSACGTAGLQARATVRRLRTATVSAWFWTQMLAGLAMRMRAPLLLAAGNGILAGTASFLAGPFAAPLVSGLAIGMLTLSCVALRRVQTLMAAFQPTTA